MLALAERAALGRLADEHLPGPTDDGANAALKVASPVAGMVAGSVAVSAARQTAGVRVRDVCLWPVRNLM